MDWIAPIVLQSSIVATIALVVTLVALMLPTDTCFKRYELRHLPYIFDTICVAILKVSLKYGLDCSDCPAVQHRCNHYLGSDSDGFDASNGHLLQKIRASPFTPYIFQCNLCCDIESSSEVWIGLLRLSCSPA